MSERSDKFRENIALVRAALDFLDSVLKKIENSISPEPRKERFRDWPPTAKSNLWDEITKNPHGF